MKALVIAPQPFFSPRGTPFSVYYRTLVMAELGVEIDLLTYGEGRDVDIPGVRIIRIPHPGFLPPVRIGPSALKACLDVVLTGYLIALLLRNRYDFVHAHEEAVFPCLALKRLFRFKLLYDMHSSLPQQLTNFRFSSAKLLIAAFERLERASLRRSEAVITICPALADTALRQMEEPGRHFLVENSIFEPVRLLSSGADDAPNGNTRQTKCPPRWQGRPLVVYAGTLESYQGIELLLRAFQRVSEKLSDAFLLVVGGTPKQLEQYQALARELGIASSCHFTGRVLPEAASGYSAGADVLVSPRVAGINTPLKIYEQLASGIPLVATRIDSHTQVLDEDVAFLADPTPAALGAAIARAIQDDAARTKKTACARALYDRKYSRSAYVSKVEAVLEKLSGEIGGIEAQRLAR
jgi:glycosyltransferase involved in cell wall biosynthesis